MNKDFYYSDVCMSKDEWQQFKEWINKKQENKRMVLNIAFDDFGLEQEGEGWEN